VKIIKPEEDSGNNRSVMTLDAPRRTRATMIIAVSFLQSSCVAYYQETHYYIYLLLYFNYG